MGNETKHSATMSPALSLRAAAREYQLSPWTVRAAIQSGDLPAYRLPGQRRLRILREDILAWVRRHPVESVR